MAVQLMLNGQYLKHGPHAGCPGVTQDSTMKSKQHLTKAANKAKSCKNLLMKLTDSSSDADTNTFDNDDDDDDNNGAW